MTPSATLPGWWDYRFAVLSIAIAMCASYTALDLAARASDAKGQVRFGWLAGGAIAMGSGIWSMHYVGMLAFHLPVVVVYNVPTVIVSLLTAIFASAAALWVVSRKRPTLVHLGVGSLVMGCGIAAVHYTGMAAMRMPADCHYNPMLVTLSVVIAVAVSFVAMVLAFYLRVDTEALRWLRVVAAELMGIAIALMYYTSMAAARFTPADGAGDISHAVRVSDLGSVGIAVVTGMFLGLTVLGSLRRKRSRTATAVRESEERTRMIIETALDAVITMDTSDTVTGWNAEAERTFGWSCKEALGRSVTETIVPPQYRDAHKEGLRRFLETGEGPILGQRIEITGLHRDGHEFPVEMALSAAHVQGRWLFSSFFRDITDRKQAEEASKRSHEELEERVRERTAELMEAKEAAEAASRAKSEFLANMSHEIRTPMNGVIGMTELALDTSLTSEQRQYLSLVKTSADSLLTVINDILDFSKIEAGKLDLDLIDFNLRDSVEAMVQTLGPKAHEKGLELVCDFRPEAPSWVHGDPARLRQIVMNLAGNAVKFTQQGEVVVRVDLDSEDERGPLLRFSIRDTGIGIPKEKQGLIFQAFSQADTSTTRRYGGTGLGLTISSRLVEMMGGRIWVVSEEGEGSAFHFTAHFGLANRAFSEGEAALPEELAGLPALVVDDNQTNRRLLSEMLAAWGMKPKGAESAMAALEAMRRACAGATPFHLILTDAHMPGMDGFELAEQIRNQPEIQDRLPLVMMFTSAGQRGDAARCRALGVAAYLTKPIRKSELHEAILKVLGKRQDNSHTAGLVTRHSLREEKTGLRILLAEDNTVNQRLAQRMLEKRGYFVQVAANGREALAALDKSRFDIVLMDVQMPEMDGLEATAAIREKEKSSGMHVPVIAMTARAMAGDREECLAAGMDEYVSKPVQPQQLFDAIHRLSAHSAEAGNPREAQDTGESVYAARGMMTMDKRKAIELADGDAQLLAEMSALFLKSYPRRIGLLRQAIACGDAAEVSAQAHALKGSAGSFAATAAFNAATELEQLGRCATLAHADAALFKLETALSELEPALMDIVQRRTEIA